MIRRIRMISLLSLSAVSAFALLPSLVHAGCGGGTRSVGFGGHSFGRARATTSCGSGVGCGMNMTGMAGMAAPAVTPQSPLWAPQAPATAAQGAAHYYTCPMHPGVASSTPGACPYCNMALSYR